jgi:hypothetical protein
MDALSSIVRNFLNDPSNDFIGLLAALIFITWGVALAINRWDAFEQRTPDDDQL